MFTSVHQSSLLFTSVHSTFSNLFMGLVAVVVAAAEAQFLRLH